MLASSRPHSLPPPPPPRIPRRKGQLVWRLAISLLRFGLACCLRRSRLLIGRGRRLCPSGAASFGHRHVARGVWRPRGGRTSLGARLRVQSSEFIRVKTDKLARLAKERIWFPGGPVEATAFEASVLLAPVAHEEKAEFAALVARVSVTRHGELAILRVATAQCLVFHWVVAACGDLHERREAGARHSGQAAALPQTSVNMQPPHTRDSG